MSNEINGRVRQDGEQAIAAYNTHEPEEVFQTAGVDEDEAEAFFEDAIVAEEERIAEEKRNAAKAPDKEKLKNISEKLYAMVDTFTSKEAKEAIKKASETLEYASLNL